MSLKSILRALGAVFGAPEPQLTDRAQMPVTDRLTSRSDWNNPHTVASDKMVMGPPGETYMHGGWLPRADPAPLVAPWDRPRSISTDGDGVDLSGRGPPDLWPVTDDPYVDPEPCKVVQDEGLNTIRDYAARTNENTRKLAERGLTGRLENLKIVGDILDLVERQDAAEKLLGRMGWKWNGKEWQNVHNIMQKL